MSEHPLANLKGGNFAYCGKGDSAPQEPEGISWQEMVAPKPSRTDWLVAKGRSMTGFGIEDGYTVFVERCPSPRDGWVILCVYDGECVIKRYHEKNGVGYLGTDYGDGTRATIEIVERFVFLGRVVSFIPPMVKL